MKDDDGKTITIGDIWRENGDAERRRLMLTPGRALDFAFTLVFWIVLLGILLAGTAAALHAVWDLLDWGWDVGSWR